MSPLIDRYNRVIRYLRISITDRCNLRCIYCMPKDGVPLLDRRDILSYEEIERITRTFIHLGITSVRITGGEPLLRRDIIYLISKLSNIQGISDLSITTNGTLLSRYAESLKSAGLNRVNISLDSLYPKRFFEITQGGNLKDVLDGIDSVLNADLTPVKINMVVMKGINDNEVIKMVRHFMGRPINLRFIECMPINRKTFLPARYFIPMEEVEKMIRREFHLEHEQALVKGAGPADYYRIKGDLLRVGFISPISQHFCSNCNKVRLTADGRLRLCLLEERKEFYIGEALHKGISDRILTRMIKKVIRSKPFMHRFNPDNMASCRYEFKNLMSSIGG